MADTTPRGPDVAEQHTLLIFGGSGLLGRNLIAWAVAETPWTVHSTYLTHAPTESAGYTATACDILDGAAVSKLVENVAPSIIVNAAYRQAGLGAAEICSIGAGHVAAAAAQGGARLIHVSTDLVFDGAKGQSYSEVDPVSPISDYGRAKAAGEILVGDAHHDVAIVRTSIIYGEPNAPQERLVRQAITHGDISFFVDEWRSPVMARDLAAAIGTLGSSAHRGLVHVAGDERLNRLDLARLLATNLGLDATRLSGRTQDPSLGPRPQDVSLDCALSHSLGLRLPGPTERLDQSRSDSS